MPAVSYDGRSFQIDGRRVWLVSRTFEYYKYRPEQWLGMLKGIRGSGFSGVNLPVPWGRVEVSPGKFRFEGELDIQKAVRLAGEAGLHCVLDPGPANLPGEELAGMPSWILGVAGVKLRQANPGFMSAVSRYYSALWEQVRDLQAASDTGPGASSKSGPILLVKLEGSWISHQSEDVPDYLAELARFHREDGCRVPLVLSNMMWHRVDTVVSAWKTDGNTLSTARQLGAVQEEAPRLFLDLVPAKERATVSALQVSQALAGAAQLNLPAAASDVSAEGRALLHFGSSFGFLFASLNVSSNVPVIDPSTAGAQPGMFSLVGQSGSQGEVIFLFGSQVKGAKAMHVPVMLANGRKEEIAPGAEGVAWGVLDARLPGLGVVSTMMSPLAWHLKKMLVVKAEHEGHVVVAGTKLAVPAATEKAASVVAEQGVVIVGLSQSQSERFWPVGDGVVVGPTRLDGEGNPDLSTAAKGAFHVGLDGKVKALKAVKAGATAAGAAKGVGPVQVSGWRAAGALEGVLPLEAFTRGSAERTVEGVSPTLGAAWHEVQLPKGLKEQKLIAPEWGDEVALYSSEGKALGRLTGANPRVKTALPERVVIFSRRQRSVVLTEWPFHKPSGPVGGLYVEGAAIKAEVTQTPVPKVDLWEHQPFLPFLHKLVLARAHAYKAMFKTNAARVCLKWPIFAMPTAVLLNGQFVGIITSHGEPETRSLVLHEGVGLKRGGNDLVMIDWYRIAQPQDVVAKKNAPELVELGADVLAAGTWRGIAPIIPADEAFVEAGKWKGKAGPTWFKCAIKAGVPTAPMTVILPEVVVNEVVFNGKRVTKAEVDKEDPETDRFVLEPAMFLEGGGNELALLSAEGKAPGKVRVE
jgi:hypothetical protein